VITQLAQGAVELQLMLQAWLLARFGRIAAGEVPGQVLRPGVELWEAQIRIWMPADVPLPPFIVAIVLTGMASLPVQVLTGQPIPKASPKTSPPTKAPVDGPA